MSEINKYNKVPDHIKILNKIFQRQSEIICYIMHFIQWKSICHSNYIWIILVDEFHMLHFNCSKFVLLFITLIILFGCPHSISCVL